MCSYTDPYLRHTLTLLLHVFFFFSNLIINLRSHSTGAYTDLPHFLTAVYYYILSKHTHAEGYLDCFHSCCYQRFCSKHLCMNLFEHVKLPSWEITLIGKKNYTRTRDFMSRLIAVAFLQPSFYFLKPHILTVSAL